MSVPADRVAPSGTPEMVTLSVSEPSVSVSSDEIVSGIAVSSLPVASSTTRVGASASGSTETAIVPVVVAVSPFSPSVEVAVTVSSKSSSEFSAGVIVRPSS